VSLKPLLTNTCSIEVLLNGKTATIPLQFSTNKKLVFERSDEFNRTLAAVASINKACEALHTGKDGISKTWSEVAVHADVLLSKLKWPSEKCPACVQPFHRE
jgi:hypothetical protein